MFIDTRSVVRSYGHEKTARSWRRLSGRNEVESALASVSGHAYDCGMSGLSARYGRN